MSSAWWLGWTCMLGLGQMSQTAENLIRTRQCVINLPSVNEVAHVDRLAMTTGRDPVPELKKSWGYEYEGDKFGRSGLTPVGSDVVAAPRVMECPVQMEGVLHRHETFGKNVKAYSFEVHIERLHVHESLLVGERHVDPEKWSPLLMSFCRFFGIGEEAHPSRLAASGFLKAVQGAAAAPSR